VRKKSQIEIFGRLDISLLLAIRVILSNSYAGTLNHYVL